MRIFLMKLAMVVVTGAFLSIVNVALAQDGGVKCGAGFSAQFHVDKHQLWCKKLETIRRDSACPPPNSPSLTELDVNGSDTCKARPGASVGATLPAVASTVRRDHGDPAPSAFTRLVVRLAVDIFTADREVYAFPEGIGGNPGFSGDASNGVRCAKLADQRLIAAFSLGVLKCNYSGEIRPATCDAGLTHLNQYGEDRCVTATGQLLPTKPQGVSTTQGWQLLVDPSGSQDSWQKAVVSHFEWPVVLQ